MALKSRLDLKGYFQDGKKLSSSDFTALIDSTLNKYDDCFMGMEARGELSPGEQRRHI